VTSSARVAMETSKLLVGGGVSSAGDAVTSSSGSPKNYGGAQQLSSPVQQPGNSLYVYW